MKFLIDNALPPRLAGLLLAAGHDAVHVRIYGMHAASDEAILQKALEEDRVIVSADSDFGALLAAHDYANAILLALPVLEPELMAGCVAVFRHGRLRVRKLPFSG